MAPIHRSGLLGRQGGVTGGDVGAVEKRMISQLERKWWWEYLEMAGIIWDMMYLTVVRSNSLLLRGHKSNHGLMGRQIV